MVDEKFPELELMEQIVDYYNAYVLFGRESQKARSIVEQNRTRFPQFVILTERVDSLVKSTSQVPWGKDGLGR